MEIIFLLKLFLVTLLIVNQKISYCSVFLSCRPSCWYFYQNIFIVC